MTKPDPMTLIDSQRGIGEFVPGDKYDIYFESGNWRTVLQRVVTGHLQTPAITISAVETAEGLEDVCKGVRVQPEKRTMELIDPFGTDTKEVTF